MMLTQLQKHYMDFKSIYLSHYQGRYLEIEAETTDEAKKSAFIRFNAKNISDIDVHLTDVEYDPYYLTAVIYGRF